MLPAAAFDDPDGAEVDEPESPVVFEEDVAGVQVGVEDAVHQDLFDDRRHQRLSETITILGGEGREAIDAVAQRRAVDEVHREHALSRSRLEDPGSRHDAAAGGLRAVDEVEGGEDHPGVPGLDPVVEFFHQCAREPPRDGLDPQIAADAGAHLGPVRETADDVGIRFDLGAGGGALHLHDDRGAVAQDGAVDLRH